MPLHVLIKGLPEDSEALLALASRGAAAVDALALTLGDRGAPRQQLLDALDRIGPAAAKALPRVADLLVDWRCPAELVVPALRVAGTTAPFADEESRIQAVRAVRTLTGGRRFLTGHDRDRRRWLVARFHARVQAQKSTTACRLLANLRSDDPVTVELAVDMLRHRRERAALQALERLLLSGFPKVFETAQRNAKPTRSKVPHYDLYLMERSVAAAVLELGGDGPTAAPGHLWFLVRGGTADKRAAAGELGRYGLEERHLKVAVFVLCNALADRDPVVVRRALESLGTFAPQELWVKNRIAGLVQHRDDRIALQAGKTLERLRR